MKRIVIIAVLLCMGLAACCILPSSCRRKTKKIVKRILGRVEYEEDEEIDPIVPIAVKGSWDDLTTVKPDSGDWPWWRGPTHNNIASGDQEPPLTWSVNQNIKWHVDLPGTGHSTPCVSGKNIYIAAANKEKQKIWILCLDRESGDEVWRTQVNKGNIALKMHADNSLASATPACDGERVFFPYQTDDAIMMAALDLKGNILWNQKISYYKTVQGFSASPVIYKSAVIVAADTGPAGCLAALNRKTGEVIWRMARPGDNENYASPLLAHVSGKDQLVIPGPKKTSSYDPNNGSLIWRCDGPATYIAATIAFSDTQVFATGGYPEKALLAINADGSGDVTATHLNWKSDNKAPYVPTPLYDNGLLYAMSDNGRMRCYDASDGTVVWEQRIGGNYYSSPVLVGERIYVFDRTKGYGFVMKKGRKYELLAKNQLPAGAFATPVISKGRIYLRTLMGLYCIGK